MLFFIWESYINCLINFIFYGYIKTKSYLFCSKLIREVEDMVGGNTIEQGHKLNSRNAFLKEVSILNSDLG